MLEIEKKGEHDRQRSYLKLDIMFEIKKIDEHGWKVGFQIRVFFFMVFLRKKRKIFVHSLRLLLYYLPLYMCRLLIHYQNMR